MKYALKKNKAFYENMYLQKNPWDLLNFTPVFLREKILLPRFDASPLELAESLLAIAVFCCDFSRKKTLAAGNSWVYISTVP